MGIPDKCTEQVVHKEKGFVAFRPATHAPVRCHQKAEKRPPMAQPAVVELPLKGKRKKAMFLRADLFVCALK